VPEVKRLLAVVHSRAGTTKQLCDAAIRGAREATGSSVELVQLDAFEAGPEDVLLSSAILIATPARFGYMSGACKDFLERIYHPCLERTGGLPYCLLVKGDTDVDGAVQSVQKIVTGMRWRLVLPPMKVVGELSPQALGDAEELGATLAAGIETGIF